MSGHFERVFTLGGDTQPSKYSRTAQILIDDGSLYVAPQPHPLPGSICGCEVEEDKGGQLYIATSDPAVLEQLPPGWVAEMRGERAYLRPEPGCYSVDNPLHIRPHDVFVEPSASRRAALKAKGNRWMIIDPQHGGSVSPYDGGQDAEIADRRDSAGRPVSACIAAFRLGHVHGSGEYERIILRPDAGLDDYAAAAVEADMVRPLPYSDDVRARLEAISVADNVSWAGLPEWAPGQRINDVTTTFPGLGRICACSALTPRRRAELVAEWLMTGGVSPAGEECLALGYHAPAPAHEAPQQALSDLDAIAVREREAAAPEVVPHLQYDPACEVCAGSGESPEGDCLCGEPILALVTSPMTGLSGGRGAIGYGYRYAPVVVACSPLPSHCDVAAEDVAEGSTPAGGHASDWSPRHLVTIARAPNASRVSVDWPALLAELNEREPGWGGNLQSGIVGSPKPGGTALALAEVARAVARHVREQR